MVTPETLLLADQPELPGLEAACVDVGLAAVPQGLAQLTRKQREFTLAFLETGNATEAARRAGYSSPESDASKVQKTPGVAAVLAQAVLPVAKNADQIILRVSERARFAHAMFELEAAKPATHRSLRTIREWMAVADKADALLGTLLGRIRELTINTTHIGVVSVEDRAHLIELQQQGVTLGPAPVQGGRNS